MVPVNNHRRICLPAPHFPRELSIESKPSDMRVTRRKLVTHTHSLLDRTLRLLIHCHVIHTNLLQVSGEEAVPPRNINDAQNFRYATTTTTATATKTTTKNYNKNNGNKNNKNNNGKKQQRQQKQQKQQQWQQKQQQRQQQQKQQQHEHTQTERRNP